MKRLLISFLLLMLLPTLASAAATVSIAAEDTSTYDQWLPTDSSTLNVLISVTGATSEGEPQLRFTDVSNWPGFCMNAGDTTNRKQDLCIYSQSDAVFSTVADAKSQTPLGTVRRRVNGKPVMGWDSIDAANGTTQVRFFWTSDANLPDNFTIRVTVTCEDYSAFGTLQARLYKDAPWYTVGLAGGIDETASMSIPKDINNNQIADAWEVSGNGWSSSITAETDDEPSGIPGNSHKGDGFTAYEEYRGFHVNGVHKRLKLNRKDVFVHSEFDPTFYQLPSSEQVWLGRATDANGNPLNGFPSVFQVHFIAKTEMDTNHVVNFNETIRRNVYEYWIVSQKAVYIKRDTTKAFVAGGANTLGEADTSAQYNHKHSHPGGINHIHGACHMIFTKVVSC